MIQTPTEYAMAKEQVKNNSAFADAQRSALYKRGYSDEEVERGMEPITSFHLQLVEEVEYYEKTQLNA